MRNVLLLTAFAIPFVALAQREPGVGVYGYSDEAAPTNIERRVQYDKFKDRTVVSLKHPLELHIDMGDLNALTLNAYYSCQGNDPLCRPIDVLLVFTAISDSWRFIKSDRDLILLMDEHPLSFGQLDWDGGTSEGSPVRTWESMTVTVATESFEQILRANFVEGQLGHRTFKIEPEHLIALRAQFKFPPESSEVLSKPRAKPKLHKQRLAPQKIL